MKHKFSDFWYGSVGIPCTYIDMKETSPQELDCFSPVLDSKVGARNISLIQLRKSLDGMIFKIHHFYLICRLSLFTYPSCVHVYSICVKKFVQQGVFKLLGGNITWKRKNASTRYVSCTGLQTKAAPYSVNKIISIDFGAVNRLIGQFLLHLFDTVVKMRKASYNICESSKSLFLISS